jgi:hypothetical protein
MRVSVTRMATVAAVAMATVGLVAQGRQGRGGGAAGQPASTYVIKPARVFDGDSNDLHEGWAVRVRGTQIEAAGPAAGISTDGATVIDLPDTTLLP